MTIIVSLTNPAEHQSSELRALAHFLNVLAADREGGAIDIKTGTPGLSINPNPEQLAELRRMAASSGPAIIEPGKSHPPTVPAPGEVQPGPGGEIPAVPNVPASTPATVEPGETAPTTSEGSSLVDVNGVTWDERIHSATQSKNADGSWRQKRGVDAELVKTVLGEQQGAPAIPEVPAVPTPTPPAETPPPVPAASAAAAVLPVDVIRFVTGNKIEASEAVGVYQQFGLSNAAGLFSQPELAPAIMEAMQQLVG